LLLLLSLIPCHGVGRGL